MDLAEALRAPDTFATTLLVAAADRLGPRLLADDPGTTLARLEAACGDVPAAGFDRLMAACAVAGTDRFRRELPAFCRLVPVLSGAVLADFVPVALPLEEIAWALCEAHLIDPPDPGDDRPYAPEILAYVGRVADAEGMTGRPDVLAIAAGAADRARRALAEHAGDPRTRADIRQVESARTAEIEGVLRRGLARLGRQLAGLRLTDGAAGAALGRLAAKLQGPAPEEH